MIVFLPLTINAGPIPTDQITNQQTTTDSVKESVEVPDHSEEIKWQTPDVEEENAEVPSDSGEVTNSVEESLEVPSDSEETNWQTPDTTEESTEATDDNEENYDPTFIANEDVGKLSSHVVNFFGSANYYEVTGISRTGNFIALKIGDIASSLTHSKCLSIQTKIDNNTLRTIYTHHTAIFPISSIASHLSSIDRIKYLHGNNPDIAKDKPFPIPLPPIPPVPFSFISDNTYSIDTEFITGEHTIGTEKTTVTFDTWFDNLGSLDSHIIGRDAGYFIDAYFKPCITEQPDN